MQTSTCQILLAAYAKVRVILFDIDLSAKSHVHGVMLSGPGTVLIPRQSVQYGFMRRYKQPKGSYDLNVGTNQREAVADLYAVHCKREGGFAW